jgi:hypothetical protein
MKKILALFLALASWLRAEEKPINAALLLDCIQQVEGASTDYVGRAGERSRFQITAAVWYDYTNVPFSAASSLHPDNLVMQYRVARRHLDYLIVSVKRPNVYRIAAAWNGGRSAVNRDLFNDRMVDYATRVRNLYREANK